jgi:predicted DsbA family dithiol-disulfide isomerase
MTSPSPRRERRTEQLARRKKQKETARPAWASPIALVTLAALIAGAALVAVLVFSGSRAPSDGGGEILRPAFPSPPPILEHGRSLGEAGAPVKIEAWEDFQCPVCNRFTQDVEPQLISAYVATGKVQLTYHDLAFIGPESTDAAAAARVSEAIGPGFWPRHDLVFANQGAENSGAFSRDRLASMAVLLGMDRAAFLSALGDTRYQSAVTVETRQGTAAGITQTPTLVINGVSYAGLPPFQNLAAIIDAASASAAPGAGGPVPNASPSGP